MKLKPFALLIAVAVLLTFPAAERVSAHAEVDRSTPKADETVNGNIDMLEIWFTEEIAEGSKIDVADESGTSVTSGEAEVDLFDPDRKRLTVGLLPNLPDGVYTVSWTSVSAADGDTASDSFTFTIAGSGTPSASPVASPAASPPAAKVSGSLQTTQPKAQEANIDDRALMIAVGAGGLGALFIYGFWRLVRPKRHPFDRTGR